MDVRGFIREVYRRATPSVDFDKAEKIVPWEHQLKVSEYEAILKEFGVKEGTDEMFQCNMWMLNSGPQLAD